MNKPSTPLSKEIRDALDVCNHFLPQSGPSQNATESREHGVPGPALTIKKSPEQVRLEDELEALSSVLPVTRDSLANNRADPALCSHASYLLRALGRSLLAAVSS